MIKPRHNARTAPLGGIMHVLDTKVLVPSQFAEDNKGGCTHARQQGRYLEGEIFM